MIQDNADTAGTGALTTLDLFAREATNAAELGALLRGAFGQDRLVLRNEFALHDEIARRLDKLRVSYSREVRKGKGKRPDFMAGTVAIEVKVGGQPLSILRQLKRYADDATITSVLLVTTKPLNCPETLGGKPISVLSLWKNLL